MALLIAGAVMAVSIVVFAGAVGYIAMPALAGLLMLVGFRTVKPNDILAVWKTGSAQAVTMAVTFVLTMLIPLQNAVLVGVGISVILFVIRQSGTIDIKRRVIDDAGDVREEDPPRTLGRDEVVVLQPYGNLFFASAPVFDEQLPEVTEQTHNSVVVLRLRGQSDVGSTLMEVLSRYSDALRRRHSKLMLIYSDDRIRYQLEATGVYSDFEPNDIYKSSEWLGRTMKQAHRDALEWVESRR
jgi:SulP family sulfate permease